MTRPKDRITELLQGGSSLRSDELVPLVYDELKQLARARLAAEKVGHTLQPTALVHEAWMRVADGSAWDSRRHFFGAAAEAMRRILIESARRKQRLRRGGDVVRVPLEGAATELRVEPPTEDLLVVEEALNALEAADPRARQIVNLRYFVGMSGTETAEVLGVSVATVERDWRFIRTFLQGALE